MSNKLQADKMRKLVALGRKELGYIYDGDGDCGHPAGDKKAWLNTGKAFLRALAKDLGFEESKVWANPGGIAVAGESTLMGMWGPGNGMYISVVQPMCGCGIVLYRSISNMKGYSGGSNNWISSRDFSSGDYEGFVGQLMRLDRAA